MSVFCGAVFEGVKKSISLLFKTRRFAKNHGYQKTRKSLKIFTAKGAKISREGLSGAETCYFSLRSSAISAVFLNYPSKFYTIKKVSISSCLKLNEYGETMKSREMYETAHEYLRENMGNQVSAGDVYHDNSTKAWNVKIISKTPHGILIVGEISLDDEKTIVYVTLDEQVLKLLRSKLKEERVLIDALARSKRLYRM